MNRIVAPGKVLPGHSGQVRRPCVDRCRPGQVPLDGVADRFGRFQDPAALVRVAPVAGDEFQQFGPRCHLRQATGWKVGAAVKRFQVRRQKHVQGPTAGTGQGRDRGHVEPVEVGALLAVQLDADEMSVHMPGHFRVFKRFAGHHVAPVAGRVADGQKDRPILLACQRQGFRTPWIPVHGVMGVLAQIGALFGDEAIGRGCRWVHGVPPVRSKTVYGGTGVGRFATAAKYLTVGLNRSMSRAVRITLRVPSPDSAKPFVFLNPIDPDRRLATPTGNCWKKAPCASRFRCFGCASQGHRFFGLDKEAGVVDLIDNSYH